MSKRRGDVAVFAAAVMLVVRPVLPGVAAREQTDNAAGVGTAPAQETVGLAGTNRYGTAVAVSQHLYPTGADEVVIARGTDFPDALAGGPAAAHLDGPVLLINSATSVPGVVDAELARLNPNRIYVLGGSSAVGTTVVNLLKQHAPVTGLSGSDRYGTAAAVAGLWTSGAGTVYVASGRSYPDALAGGAAAAHQDAPVLLTSGTGLSRATVDRLQALRPDRVIVLGGESAVSKPVFDQIRSVLPRASVSRYAGKDRYATAAAVAEQVWPSGAAEAFYATGLTYADALAGVPAAGALGVPLLLVRKDCAPSATLRATADLGVGTQFVLGGTSAIGDGATGASCAVNPSVTPTVLEVLEEIPVKGQAPRTGYERAKFGPEWTDDNDVQGGRNGSDERFICIREASQS